MIVCYRSKEPSHWWSSPAEAGPVVLLALLRERRLLLVGACELVFRARFLQLFAEGKRARATVARHVGSGARRA